jgi:putative ABC transport system permease protein
MIGGACTLAWRHATHNPLITGALAVCLAVAMALPVATRAATARFEQSLRARAAATPLVAGAPGNRFDLTFSALHFRAGDLTPVPLREVEELAASGLGVPVGLSVRFTVRGEPLVGVGAEYFELRDLRAREGELPIMIGDVALGASLARRLDLVPGGRVYSDQRELYDIAVGPAIRLTVSGVLAPTGGPDDHAAFVDLNTIWLLDGLAHGHDDAGEVDESLLLGRAEDRIVLSPALIEHNEVTPENTGAIHLHGDSGAAPLTAILFFPHDARSQAIIKARVNTRGRLQMIAPVEVVDDLMAYILRIRRLLDHLAIVMAATTLTLIALVTVLNMKLRAREMLTLRRIGAAPGFVAEVYAAELALIAALSVLIAAALALAAAGASGYLLMLV